ncbi:MAG: hypothetical protein K5840_07985 [Eubacterium sp.]|nr:hypothetical protein [Eubacterium sp.]
MKKGAKTYEELRAELDVDPGNYRLNVEMGFYYLDVDRKQTYQYLKRALKFCDSATDTGAIEQLFTDMEYVYPELMMGMEDMLELLDEDEDSRFSAVFAGVETHGIAHSLEVRYPFASFVWNADPAMVYREYHDELDYLFMDGDEVLGSYPQVVLRAMIKVLKPGGRLLLRVSNAAYYKRILRLFELDNPEGVGEDPLYHPFMKDEIAALVSGCGFDVEVKASRVDEEDVAFGEKLLASVNNVAALKDSTSYMNRYHMVKAIRR